MLALQKTTYPGRLCRTAVKRVDEALLFHAILCVLKQMRHVPVAYTIVVWNVKVAGTFCFLINVSCDNYNSVTMLNTTPLHDQQVMRIMEFMLQREKNTTLGITIT